MKRVVLFVLLFKVIMCYSQSIETEETIGRTMFEYGEESVLFADQLHQKAISYYKNSDYIDALECEMKALKIYKKIEGENSVNYVRCLNMVAIYEDLLDNYNKAIEDQLMVIALYSSLTNEKDLKYTTYIGNLAKYYDDFGDYANAVDWGEKALLLFQELVGITHPKYINMLNVLGVIYEHMTYYSEAIQIGEKAVSIQKEFYGEMNEDYVLFLDNLSVSYISSGQVSKGIEIAQRALNIKKQLFGDIHPSIYLSLNNIMTAYMRIGKYDRAIEFGEEAANIVKLILGEDNLSFATVLTNLGLCYSKQGMYNKALELEERALFIKKEYLSDSHPDMSATIANISSIYYYMGEFNKAIAILKQQAQIVESVYGKNNMAYTTILNNLAVLYSDVGDPFSAIDIDSELLEIRKTILGENHPDYLQTLSNLAMDYNSIGQYQKAMDCLLQCESNYHASNESYLQIESTIYNNLGLCCSNQCDYEQALAYYDKALVVCEIVFGESNMYASIMTNIAAVCCKMKNYPEAIKKANQALDIQIKLFGEDCHECAQSYSCLSMIYYELGDIQKSYDMKKKQVEIMNHYFDQDSPVFIEELMVLSNLSAFFEDNEFTNSIAYLRRSMDLNSKHIKYSFQHMTTSQQSSYMKSRNILYSQVNHALFLCHKHPENDSLMIQTYNAVLLSKGLLLSSLIDSRNDKNKYSFMNVGYQDIVKNLRDTDVVVEFADNGTYASDVFIGGGYYAFVYRKNWKCPKLIWLGYKEEFSPISFREYRKGGKAEEYFSKIWLKLAKYINDGDDVYYSPSGVLHQINLEVLCDSAGVMVSDKYNLHRLSSIRQLCEVQGDENYSKSALFGGLLYDMDTNEMITQSLRFHTDSYIASRGFDPDLTNRAGWGYLPGTKAEIDSISSTLQNHSVGIVVYSGSNGTEEAFKDLSGKHMDVIHLATHGFFYENEDLKEKTFFQSLIDNELDANDNSLKRSGLILSGGQNAWLGNDVPANVEDGILLSEEIASMDLSGTDLVVLSACETGLGDITSDGVFGLQRAFKMAGVQTLVMSLWKVDDNATSLMMQTFYEHLLSGMSKRDAFNLAQAAVRAKYPEPYYWAGFIMLD